MSYKPTRTFIGNEGDWSVDDRGPDALKDDIDTINKMFDPDATHDNNEEGGIGFDNLNFDFSDNDFATRIGAPALAYLGATNTTLSGQLAEIADILENEIVHLAETETITGDKTFSGEVSVPTPTEDSHAVTKDYADNVVAEAVDDWITAHPEIVTTVQNNSVSYVKLHESAFADMGYYDEVVFTKERNHDTDCYFAEIPVTDDDGNIITLYVDHDNVNTVPITHAQADYTTLTINGNASLDVEGSDSYLCGITISNGEVINTRSFDGYGNDNIMYIGIKADRSYTDYKMDSSITPEQMLADGCTNVFNCYFKLAENSALLDYTGVHWNGYTYSADTVNPLMVIGFKSDNTILFMACDGRTDINVGLTYVQAAQLMLDKGCVDVYNLDGGGSTTMIAKGSKLNRNIDGDGVTNRGNKYTLNVKKTSRNVSVQEAYSKIGLEKQRLIEQIIPYINEVDNKSYYKRNYYTTVSGLVDALTEHSSDSCFVILAGTVTSALTGGLYSDSSQGIFIANGNRLDFILKVSTYSRVVYGRYDISTSTSLGLGILSNAIKPGYSLTIYQNYVGIISGSSVFFTVPLDREIATTVDISETWAAEGGIKLRLNGNFLAGSDVAFVQPLSLAYIHSGAGLQIRATFGNALINDVNYIDECVVGVQLRGLTISFDEPA